MSFHHETVLFTPSVFPPLSHCHEMLKPHQVPVIRLAAPHVFVKPGDGCRIDLKDLEADVSLHRLPQVKMSDHDSTGISVSHVKAEPSPVLNIVRAAVVKAEPHEEKPTTENVAQQQMWHACSRRNDSEESVATSPRVPPPTVSLARCDSHRKPDADGEVENSEVQSKKDWKELGKTWKEKEEPECEPVSSLHSQEPSSVDEAAIWVPFAPTVSEVTRKSSEQRFSQQRSCSSCQTRKTPLWRDGPDGPKTLCNACGLRHQRGRTDGKYYKRKTTKDTKKTKKAASANIPGHIAREAWREDSDNARSDSGVSTKEVSGITAVSSGTVPASRCIQAVRSSPLSSNNMASGQSADKSWKRVNRPTQKALESKLGGDFRRIGSLGSASHTWTTTHQCYRCMKQTKFQLKDGPDGANTLCNACHKRVTEAQRSPPPSSGDESEDVDLRGEADEVEMEVEEELEEKVEEVVLTGWGAVHKRKRMMCTAENSPVVRRRYFGSFPISADCCGNSSPCESDDAVGMKADMGDVSPMLVGEGEDKALSRSGSAVDLTRLSNPSCDAERISVEVLEEKLAETEELMGWKHGERVPMKVPRTDLNSKHFPGKRIKLIYGGGKVRPMKRCICCSAEDTPQWREGPKGPKTLCNACGLRFAKGRVCNHHRASKSSSGLKKLKLSIMSVDKVEEEEYSGEREREFVPRDEVQGMGLEVEGKRRRKKINRAALDEEMERGSDREARKRSKKAKQNKKKAEKSMKKASRGDGWSFKTEKWGREAGVNFVLGDDPSFTAVGLDGDKRGLAPQIRRRCTHCFQDRTPLWREGPLGPKTLCNACGIMHKRGRLDPSKCHPVSEMDSDMQIMAVDFGRGKGKGGSCGGKNGAPKKPRAVKEAGAVKPKKPRAKKADKEGKSQRQRQHHSHTSGLSMIPMDIGLNDWASEGLGELDNLESQRLCAKLGSETESDEEDYPKLAGRTCKGWVGGKPREKAAGGTTDCWSSEEALNRLFAQDSFDADEEGLLDDLPEVHELLDGDEMNGLADIEFPWVFGDPLDNLDTVTQCDVENWEVTENWLLTERPAVQAAKA